MLYNQFPAQSFDSSKQNWNLNCFWIHNTKLILNAIKSVRQKNYMDQLVAVYTKGILRLLYNQFPAQSFDFSKQNWNLNCCWIHNTKLILNAIKSVSQKNYTDQLVADYTKGILRLLYNQFPAQSFDSSEQNWNLNCVRLDSASLTSIRRKILGNVSLKTSQLKVADPGWRYTGSTPEETGSENQ